MNGERERERETETERERDEDGGWEIGGDEKEFNYILSVIRPISTYLVRTRSISYGWRM